MNLVCACLWLVLANVEVAGFLPSHGVQRPKTSRQATDDLAELLKNYKYEQVYPWKDKFGTTAKVGSAVEESRENEIVVDVPAAPAELADPIMPPAVEAATSSPPDVAIVDSLNQDFMIPDVPTPDVTVPTKKLSAVAEYLKAVQERYADTIMHGSPVPHKTATPVENIRNTLQSWQESLPERTVITEYHRPEYPAVKVPNLFESMKGGLSGIETGKPLSMEEIRDKFSDLRMAGEDYVPPEAFLNAKVKLGMLINNWQEYFGRQAPYTPGEPVRLAELIPPIPDGSAGWVIAAFIFLSAARQRNDEADDSRWEVETFVKKEALAVSELSEEMVRAIKHECLS